MDKIPLNSHQLFAFFFPGLVFVFPSIYCFYFTYVEPHSIDAFFKHYKDNEVLISFTIIVFALLSGLIIDSFRNGILEELFDKIKPIKWDFFFEKEDPKVKILYERYYNFYVFNINTITAIILSWAVLICSLHLCNVIYILIVELFVIMVLGWESFRLRREIVKITSKN
jgi:hypothetical protein